MFENKTVIVTGSSTGIGQGIAVEFARQKANLILHGRNKEGLDESKRQCIAAGLKDTQIVVVVGDIRDEAVQIELVEAAKRNFGEIHILVNNAGIAKPTLVDNFSMQDYDEILAVNLTSVVSLSNKAVPYLKKTRGNIVNISSILSTRTLIGSMAYCISKAGVDMFTKCFAAELASEGIRVNAINPGIIQTDLVHRMAHGDQEILNKFRDSHPLKRLGDVEDVAQAVVFLASDKAKFVTGARWPVDGGLSAN